MIPCVIPACYADGPLCPFHRSMVPMSVAAALTIDPVNLYLRERARSWVAGTLADERRLRQ